MIIVAGLVRPHNTAMDRNLNLLNDIFVMFVTYHLISLTDFV